MSDKLLHFPATDPPPLSKEEARKTLAQHIDEYLAKGGEIQEIPFDESREKHYPVKRDRKSQVNFLRKRMYRSRVEK